MKLIVGLGNPGKEYERTRHNAGFMAVDHLAEAFGFDEFKTLDKGKSLMTKGKIGGERVILMKPQTFMNLSGIPTNTVAHYFRINRKDIIVIYDDITVKRATIKIRTEGSSGGHNGIRSLIEHLGGDDFIRIRIGIRPEKPFSGALEDYVLGKLTKDETADLNQILKELPGVAKKLIQGETEKIIREYN